MPEAMKMSAMQLELTAEVAEQDNIRSNKDAEFDALKMNLQLSVKQDA